MKGRMTLQSEFNKGTSITFFVSLIRVQPNLNNHLNMLLPVNNFDGSECESVSFELNQIEDQLKKDVEKYENLIRQSASRMRFSLNYARHTS